MSKIHTRVKRKLGLTTSLRHRRFGSKTSKHGPRTFKTEEAAHQWATGKNINKGTYKLVPAKKNKRFKIVMNVP
ncbi:hypothetical protein CMO93_02510 [Candidatus Woesearchaeota archaeon]|nr:hypothetical protein [Candidatus Woesearchaeota archaeon]|tara:strand:- start:414 stop:635 length:222 start_codon:yes stop_codon:yes gene_type:complete